MKRPSYGVAFKSSNYLHLKGKAGGKGIILQWLEGGVNCLKILKHTYHIKEMSRNTVYAVLLYQ